MEKPETTALDSGALDYLWLPDSEIYDLLELKSVKTLKNDRGLTYFRDGQMEKYGRYQVSLNCLMDFASFPFDQQYCSFKMYIGKQSSCQTFRDSCD